MKKYTTLTIITQDEIQNITYPVARIKTALKYLKSSFTSFAIVSIKQKTV